MDLGGHDLRRTGGSAGLRHLRVKNGQLLSPLACESHIYYFLSLQWRCFDSRCAVHLCQQKEQ